MRAPENAQEIHLLSLLKAQFPYLAESYKSNLEALLDKVENGNEKEDLKPNLLLGNDNLAEAFFRIDLDLPVLFIISHPLSRFCAYRQYVIPLKNEQNFYADLAIIPIYFANYNRLSCLKLYGQEASGFFAANSRAIHNEDVAWRLDTQQSRPAQFSSMNFVLKQGTIENEVSPAFKTILSDYFKYGFWSHPKPGFSCNAHLIFSRENINHIHKVSKNIYIIRQIHEPRLERLAPYYSAWVQKALHSECSSSCLQV